MPRIARSRAFEMPASVREHAAKKAAAAPRAPTVAAVTLELRDHEPADMLAALLAGKESALAEAAVWENKGEHARADQASQRAQRLEHLLVKCSIEFVAHWTR